LIYYFVGEVFVNVGENRYLNAMYLGVAAEFLLISIGLLVLSSIYILGYWAAVSLVKVPKEGAQRFIFWSDVIIHYQQ
jgi:hypothetical protein